MKRIMFIAALLLVAGTFSACATGEALSGKDVVKGYALNGAYTELEVGNAITAVISTDADSVYVTTDKDFIDYVSVRQDRGKLSLEVSPAMKYRFAGGMPDIKVIVPVSNSLEGIDVHGASSVSSDSLITAGVLTVGLSGASGFRADIRAQSLSVDLSGASDMKGSISADKAEIELSGASSARLCGTVRSCSTVISGASGLKGLDGNLLEVEDLQFDLSGASSARVTCNGSISGKASGASSLVYDGNAATEKVSASGASSVRRK